MKEGYTMEYEARKETRRARRRHLNPKIKKALTPSVKMQERIEWAFAGIVAPLGTIVAVEVLAAIVAVMM